MNKRYHLIGIGGIGMSGIAHLLLACGFKVSGSDNRLSAATKDLEGLGAKVFIGHSPENIKDVDVVIYSSAIKDDNPEIKEARRRGLSVIKRAQALAELMRDKTVIAVTGSHGKTTTTSLIAYLLLQAGLTPTVAIGGILKNIDTNACLGNGKYFVAEADESDGSFLYYRPHYSIITNIDYEHLDYYKDLANELEAFREFMNNTHEDGCLFCCDDDPNLKKLLKSCQRRIVLFGLNKSAHIYPENIRFKALSSDFDCMLNQKLLGKFHLALGGRHNVSNALACIALGVELGIDIKTIQTTLSDYRGAKRRLEVKLDEKGMCVIDDYAHHPTEIMATLQAVKGLGKKRIIAVFQPHRYSRTKLLQDEFSRCFESADYVILTDIYAASEQPIPGVTGEALGDKIKTRFPDKEVIFLAKENILKHLLKIIRPDDLVITLGAGDIVNLSDELAQILKREVPAQ